MRIAYLFAPLVPLLALAGCNARQPAPPIELTTPTNPTMIRVTPPGEHLPIGGGCTGDIARFRAVQDADLASGKISKTVYKDIQGELAEADRACVQGDTLRAEGLLRATKARHGYPTSTGAPIAPQDKSAAK